MTPDHRDPCLFTDPRQSALALCASQPALRIKIMSVYSFWNPDNRVGRIVTACISKMFVTVCKSNKSNTLYGSRLTILHNALIVNWNDSSSNFETKKKEISLAVNTFICNFSWLYRDLWALCWSSEWLWLVHAKMKSINPSPWCRHKNGRDAYRDWDESSSDSSQAHR